jgi:hypothetical protein
MAPKKRTDIVTQDSQLTAMRKRNQDEVEKVIEKDSSSSSQRKRLAKAKPYATAAEFVDFEELFKIPKASELVSTHTGDPFFRQSRSWVSSVVPWVTVHSLHLVTV